MVALGGGLFLISEVPLYTGIDGRITPSTESDISDCRELRQSTWKREFKLPWREAGPPNHHDDKVDSDQ